MLGCTKSLASVYVANMNLVVLTLTFTLTLTVTLNDKFHCNFDRKKEKKKRVRFGDRNLKGKIRYLKDNSNIEAEREY